jgi:hypothetical protein
MLWSSQEIDVRTRRPKRVVIVRVRPQIRARPLDREDAALPVNAAGAERVSIEPEQCVGEDAADGAAELAVVRQSRAQRMRVVGDPWGVPARRAPAPVLASPV